MWTLKNLIKHATINEAEINGHWVPARPLNYQRGYTGIGERLSRAWAVFTCKADAFMWPEGQ